MTAPTTRVLGGSWPVPLLVVVLLAGACTSAGGPVLANPTAPRPSIPTPSAQPSHRPDPVPVDLPRDDGPHDRLTEWWYYTGHLQAANGARFGFEDVIFRAERGAFPTSWVSHLAITDESGDRFVFSQRLQTGPGVDRSPRAADGTPSGFDLALGPASTTGAAAAPSPWSMSGGGGTDHLAARLTSDEAALAGVPGGLAIDLALKSTKPAALHGENGWIDFGPAGGSYYYSRTSMTASGTLTLEGMTLAVSGSAWFDHQWGDFIAVGGGGWDWFAINLDDGTDLTLSLVRDADGSYPLIYGTVVAADGTVSHLDRAAFGVEVSRHWTSPATGATYPAAWSVTIPGLDLQVRLTPTVADQELDTRATTGVDYWEGSQRVAAMHAGKPLGGEAYVELTGYARSAAAAP
jgi:predicted secreted hydrolase